jgi:hypothetical protein
MHHCTFSVVSMLPFIFFSLNLVPFCAWLSILFLHKFAYPEKRSKDFCLCLEPAIFYISLTVDMYTVKLGVHFFHLGSPRPKNRVLSKKRNRASKYLYFVYTVFMSLLFIHTCHITQILMQITFSSTLYNKGLYFVASERWHPTLEISTEEKRIRRH